MAKKAKSKPDSAPPPVATATPVRPRVVRLESTLPEAPAIDDSGLSLEDLGQAYAALLQQGDVPYEEPPVASEAGSVPEPATIAVVTTEAPVPVPPEEDLVQVTPGEGDEHCELSPRSILEAMLFVGHPDNVPLTAQQVASLMRGVTVAEIVELVQELNSVYEAAGCPYTIISEGDGFRLTLREEFSDIRERFYGRVREARLSQAAIDTLAVVAYHQPVHVKQVDAMRSKPSGALLNQLVRRQLIQLERSPENRKEVFYRTTERFLILFGLDSLDDLPRGLDSP